MILFYGQMRKSDAREEALRKLQRFVDGSEPELARFLVRNLGGFSNVVTYRELVDLVLSGRMTEEMMASWRQMYAKVISEGIVPLWTKAAETAGTQVASQRPGFAFDPWHRALVRWGERRTADLLTNSTAEMRRGVRAALARGGWGESLSVDELAQVIRPVVGLNEPQVRANQRYFRTLRENGTAPKNAREKALRYAARQHRYPGPWRTYRRSV